MVFLPGASAVGLDYLNLHTRVCEFTTSVLYDRGGTGWSDRVDLPRTAAEVTDELRDVLRTAGVPAPYLLAGHSLGGAYARRFAQRFPDEVAGLLLLEPAYEEWDSYMPAPLRVGEHTGEQAPMPELTEELLQGFRRLLEQMFAEWPDSVREPLIERHLDPESFHVFALERNLPVLFEELRKGGGTPDVPLIVCTGMGIDPGQAYFMSEQLLRGQNEAKRVLYAALAESVPRGEHRVFSDGGHSWLHVERADDVLQAIRDLLGRVDR